MAQRCGYLAPLPPDADPFRSESGQRPLSVFFTVISEPADDAAHRETPLMITVLKSFEIAKPSRYGEASFKDSHRNVGYE